MTSVAVKRITKDLRDLQKDPLESNGIYYFHDDIDFLRGRALIVGPEDTPYRWGYYFFDFYYPEEYPYKPPKVVFQTREGTIRFNPNLYACGKVCVSILNTWSGPQWTACQSIRSVLLSLQSLLNEHPLQNEPGFENDVSERSQSYEHVISHENARFAVLGMLKKQPPGFDIFQSILEKSYLQNLSKFLKWCLENKKIHPPKVIRTSLYGMKIVTYWDIIIEKGLQHAIKLGATDDNFSSYLSAAKKRKKEDRADGKKKKKNKIIISKNPWSKLTMEEMNNKKTVALLKKHIIAKKITDNLQGFKKQQLCQTIWDFYHPSEKNGKEKTQIVNVKKTKDHNDTFTTTNTTNTTNTTTTKNSKEDKKKKIKMTPNKNAKDFVPGAIVQSENSLFKYQVCVRSNGIFYWKKVNSTKNTNKSI